MRKKTDRQLSLSVFCFLLGNFVRTSIKLNDSKNEAREQIQKHHDKKQIRAI